MNHLKKIINNISLIMLIITVFIIVTASAECFGQESRETWQPPERIMDAIGVKPGMKIGEAGAGRGYFTFPLARRVGSGGIVFANDISTSALNVIKEHAVREDLKNIRIVVGEVEDPHFPENNLDMVIMVYVLHEVERPIPFIKNIHAYLKQGGFLVIIERNTNEDRTHFPSFMTKKQILETVDKTEYELDRIESFLPYDNIYIYKTLITKDL